MIINSKDSATSFLNCNLHIVSRSKDITCYSAEIFGSKRNTNLNLNWIHFSSLHGFSDRYEKSFGGIEDRYICNVAVPSFSLMRSKNQNQGHVNIYRAANGAALHTENTLKINTRCILRQRFVFSRFRLHRIKKTQYLFILFIA